DAFRPTLADEVEPVRPQVPLVSKPKAFACRAERLAGARARPNSSAVIPPSAAKRIGPDADPGEEMALGEFAQLVRSNIFDAPFVNHAGRNVAGSDQVAQPFGRKRVYFVVVRSGHSEPSPVVNAASPPARRTSSAQFICACSCGPPA